MIALESEYPISRRPISPGFSPNFIIEIIFKGTVSVFKGTLSVFKGTVSVFKVTLIAKIKGLIYNSSL